jgi:Divergent InlB B-repeat domain
LARERRALSAVYGFLVLYLLIMAGLSALSGISSSQANVNQASQEAQSLVASKRQEQLAVSLVPGSVLVENRGSAVSDLIYLLERGPSGTAMYALETSVKPGSSMSLSISSTPDQVGVVTELGNIFWNSAPAVAPCSNETASLTVSSSPVLGGTVVPSGLITVCGTDSTQILAIPARGYAFSLWTGTGNGSYSGTANPVTISQHGDVDEKATFVPSVGLELSRPMEGVSVGGPDRSVLATVTGGKQAVSLFASGMPPGLSVSFNPSAVNSSLSGASVLVNFSFSGSEYGLFPLSLTAKGADGQSSTSTLQVETTPPNGQATVGSYVLYPNGIGFPREHKVAYWRGAYYVFFGEQSSKILSYGYVPVAFSRVWVSGSYSSVGTTDLYGYAFDVEQASNEVTVSDVYPASPSICYRMGTIGDGAVRWDSATGPCGYPAAPVTYDSLSYTNGLIDSQGRWWAAGETVDGSGNRYLEVAVATNGQNGWDDVYLSGPVASKGYVVPQLLQLDDGTIVLLYATYTGTSCGSGDYFTYTRDGGQTWSPVQGPETVSGSPLCYDRSSGVTTGDTLFVGGVTGTGELGYWKYDLGDDAFTSGVLAPAAAYAAVGSSSGILEVAYTEGSCSGGNSLRLLWSYDGGQTWSDSGVIGCVADYLTLEVDSPTLQVAIVSDWRSGTDLYPRVILYTI